MATEIDRPFWHPAFMPNTAHDLRPSIPTELRSNTTSGITSSTFDSPSHLIDNSIFSSWHPALRPNSYASTISRDLSSKVVPVSEAETTSTKNPIEQPFEPIHWEESEDRSPWGASSQPMGDVSMDHKETPLTSKFVSSGGQEITEDLDDVSEASIPTPKDLDAELPSTAIDENVQSELEPVSQENDIISKTNYQPEDPSSHSKHFSTMSFARTVPRDMDWGEDDDIDPAWNLQKSETDPFETMMPRDRTNSFPQVPFSNSNDTFEHFVEPRAGFDDQLKSTFEGPDFDDNDFFSQAAKNKDSVDQEPELQEEQWFNNHGGQTQDDDFERSYGGDAPGVSDIDLRYEEGLPLVENTELEIDDLEAENNPAANGKSMFFDYDEGTNDDFFSGVGISQNNEPHLGHQKQPSLERKSTIQVLDSMQFRNPGQPGSQITAVTEEGVTLVPSEDDLAAKWKAALDGDDFLDDDDFLEDDPQPAAPVVLNPEDVFGSDDEGFLEDEEPAPSGTFNEQTSAPFGPAIGTNGNFNSNDVGLSRAGRSNSTNRYVPTNVVLQPAVQQPSDPYRPSAPLLGDFSRPASSSANMTYGVQAQPPYNNFTPTQQTRPELPKAQSFADKAKGGYASPYDLPMDVVKQRIPKRSSMMQMSRGYSNTNAPPPPAPPRSTSMFTQGPAPPRNEQVPPPSRGSNMSSSPPVTISELHQPQQAQQFAAPDVQSRNPPLRSKASFFEDLPITSRPKAAGRYTPVPMAPSAVQPVPQNNAPYGVPGVSQTHPRLADAAQAMGPPNPIAPMPPAYPSASPFSSSANFGHDLVAPPKASPYANLPMLPATTPVQSNRYSPAPVQSSASASSLPATQNRYSAAPANQRALHSQSLPGTGPPIHAHQPRTSSPLAHFERSQTQPSYTGQTPPDRGNSSLQGQAPFYAGDTGAQYSTGANDFGAHTSNASAAVTSSGFQSSPPRQFQSSQNAPTFPPVPEHGSEYQQHGNTSPRKQSTLASEHQYGVVNQDIPLAPPRRSQTQSPGKAFTGSRVDMSVAEPHQRPTSVHGPASPRLAHERSSVSNYPNENVPMIRARGFSQSYNYIMPHNGTETDKLERWKAPPIFRFHAGSAPIASMFAIDVPRYHMQQGPPQIMRSSGVVKSRSLKDIMSVDSRLTTFPGPLKNKSKKKDLLAWLIAETKVLESELQYLPSLPVLSFEDKRKEERLLLWKILTVMVENDGILEGTAVVNAAIRAVLTPGLEPTPDGAPPHYSTGADLSGIHRAVGSVTQADPVNPAAVDELRKLLLRGERDKAVWEAVDKRLWAHAMLISSTIPGDLFKQVTQEFVQKEVKSIGQNIESLAALYEVFAGNHEEMVDELVPASARAGYTMMNASGQTSSKNAMEGLDRWRETLGLILSNRSENDHQAINALGKLLAGYGRAEAAHICFFFARASSIFSGLDDPLSNIVLVSSDHIRQKDLLHPGLEPILLSEVYEFALTLSNKSNIPLSFPHLSAYKMQHASILAQYGQREKALEYYDTIASSINSQTRRSPYHHALLTTALDDLSDGLRQSPKDGSSSWISKPSMDRVSTSFMSKFNKFVQGEDKDSTDGPGSDGGSDVGAFTRLASATPTISRSPSNADLSSSYPGASTNGFISPPTSKISSRYAPGRTYTPPTTYTESLPGYGSPPEPRAPAFDSRQPREAKQYMDEPRTVKRESSTGSYQGASHFAPHNEIQSTPAYNPYSPLNHTSTGFVNPATQGFDDSRPGFQQVSSQLSTSGTYSQTPGYGVADARAAEANPETHNSQYQHDFRPSHPNQPSLLHTESNFASSTGPEQSNSTEDYGKHPLGTGGDSPSVNSYEPPSFVPYSQVDDQEPDSPIDTRSKKKSWTDDDNDNEVQTREKTRAEKDREAEEAFRKAAEADAQKDAPAVVKKGWGLGGWFGGGAKKEDRPVTPQPNKPIRAKLGEESSFVYDPELKRWINKKAGKDAQTEASSATPPPPKGPPRTSSGPPGLGMSNTSAPRSSLGPNQDSAGPPQRAVSAGTHLMGSNDGLMNKAGEGLAVPPPMMRSASSGSAGGGGSPSAPPSRPSTSMSNASSIDDLLGPPAARKGGAAKKAKKANRYIDVMQK